MLQRTREGKKYGLQNSHIVMPCFLKETVSSRNPVLALGLGEQKALDPYVCVAFEGV